MGSITGIKVFSLSIRKSKGRRNNKDVIQDIIEKDSRFWKKLNILLGYTLLSSKGEGSINDKNKQDEGIYILSCRTILLRIYAIFLFQFKMCF